MNLFAEFWRVNSGGELFEKKESLSKSEISEIQKKIAELQSKGYPSNKIITALQKFNSKLSERYRAAAAYWTEVKAIDTQTVADIGENLGISKYKVILSPSACDICREKTNNGNRIFTQKEVEKTSYGQFVPFHPNCVAPDTIIIAPATQQLLRAHYSGNLIKIFLSNGCSLSVTENHAILTSSGFATANILKKGDKIVYSPIVERIVSRNPDNGNKVPMVGDIFRAAVKNSSVLPDRVPVTPEYIHGDGRFCNGDIDIIPTDRLLPDTFEPFLREHIKEFLLGRGEMPNSFNGLGDFESMLIALALTADGIVGGASVADILLLGSTAVDKLKGLLDITNYNARLAKITSNDRTANIKLTRDGNLAYADLIQFLDVINIEVIPYHGDVFDVSTTSSLYITNGVISSNCYCIAIPFE